MTFFLCLAAALCAENIPVMFLLTVAAVILSFRSDQGRYYRTCPYCSAHLDPGEVCDCQNKETAPGAATPRAVKWKQPSSETKLFRPHCTGAGKGSQV